MSLSMFAYVLHRVFSRPGSKVADLLTAVLPFIDRSVFEGGGTTALLTGITFLLSYAGIRTMRPSETLGPLSRLVSLACAALVTYVLVILVVTVLEAFPNGLYWAPKVALICMFWVGLLGASVATYERRHLALEMGEKLWPKKARRWVSSFAFLASAAMCIALLALAYLSIKQWRDAWILNPLTGIIEPTEIPRWVALLVLPYTFLVMTLRFIGQSIAVARTKVKPEEQAS
jgi:TRAP-type C4-dicarboxylate transport system permease small subunit